MNSFLRDFADAVTEINQTVPANNSFRPGIGPYGEDQIVDLVMERIGHRYPGYAARPDSLQKKKLSLENYKGITGRAATPDLILPGKILEFKIARPIRDNGDTEDTWFKKCFEPFPESYSTFIDVAKLCRFHKQFDSEARYEK